MDLWKSLSGNVRLKLTSADVSTLLRVLVEAGVTVVDIVPETDLTVLVTVLRRDISTIKKIVERRAEHFQIERKIGIYWMFCLLKKRILLIVFLCFLMGLSCYLPTKVLFIQVKGNHIIPDNMIVEAVEKCGITFGCDRTKIKTNQIKSQLIKMIPEIRWVGITTSGCVATVEVNEQVKPQQTEKQINTVSNIIAATDGVIQQITVINGTAICQPGQAVQEGQLLISGYEDVGLCIRTAHAKGEVFAQTYHTIKAVTPTQYTQKSAVKTVQKRFSLLIGKKQINFYKDSGISPSSCVKMYSRKYVTLPGGFHLPIALIQEEIINVECFAGTLNEEQASFLNTAPADYLKKQMIAGQILSARTKTQCLNNKLILIAEYICNEQIGKTKYEEILSIYGENN